MIRHLFSLKFLNILCLMVCWQALRVYAQPLPAYQPAVNTPIMTLDQIKPGMRGYGLSVFNGTAIEPFEVEVVSVNFGIAPGVGAIWIRCPDKRMQLNGVVQGMSGSPIYLWPQETPNTPKVDHVPGKGGKLIGAFAFGFGSSKDCFVGVRPIELMRQVASRAIPQSIKQIKQAAQVSDRKTAVQMLRTLKQLAISRHLPEAQIKLLDQYVNLAQGPVVQLKAKGTITATDFSPTKTASEQATQARSMLMPMALSAPGLASLMRPLFEPLGIAPVQAPANSSAKLPSWVKPDQLQLRPGASLSVPLAWGDMDLAAIGTVTDVLADGTILAFGHAMSNQGSLGIGTINLPVATSFIHLVMPSNDISFKLGGTARLVGTMIRDENAAVIAVPEHYYNSAKITVQVHQYQQKPQKFSYNVVRNPQYTALLSAILPIQSLFAVSGGPEHQTTFFSATLTFANGKTLTVDRIIPGNAMMDIVMSIMPPISLMLNNAFESVPLEKLDVKMNVIPELLAGSIIEASLDQTEIAPGKKIGINFTVLPFNKPEKKFRTFFKIPENMPDGDYQLQIVNARTYASMMLRSRPHLSQITNTDQLFENLRLMNRGKDDRLYVMMQTQDKGLAIGQNEMPLLPSSRVALMTNPTSTLATPYTQWITHTIDTGMVIRSNVRFTVGIRSNLKNESESN